MSHESDFPEYSRRELRRLRRLARGPVGAACAGLALAVLVLATVCGAVALGLPRYRDWGCLLAVPAVPLLFMCASLLPSLGDDRVRPLTAVSPEAWETIRRTLAAAGHKPPHGVVLQQSGTYRAYVARWPRRRVIMEIGLPLVLALPADDLPILAAHALAGWTRTGDPRTAWKLGKLRRSFAQRGRALAEKGSTDSAKARRIDRFLAATEPFAHDVLDSDAAALAVAGGDAARAAGALYRAELVARGFFVDFHRFRPLMERKKRVPAGLYGDWLRDAWYGAPERAQRITLYALDDFRRGRPGFADVALDPLRVSAGLRSGEYGAPALCLLPPALERQYARRMARRFADGEGPRARAVRADRIDPALVYGPGHPACQRLLTVATAILGHPATPDEIVRMLNERRIAELIRAYAAPAVQPGTTAQPDTAKPVGRLVRGVDVLAILLSGALEQPREQPADAASSAR